MAGVLNHALCFGAFHSPPVPSLFGIRWPLVTILSPHAPRSTPHGRRGPPSLPRAEPVPALPTRQEVNMLRHATFSGFGRNLARLVFGVSCCKISPCVCFSLDSRGPRLWP